MDLSKHLEFFNPETVGPVHIIGCGAIGSTLAEMLARIGITEMHLYDFDIVNAHNIANQMFLNTQIGWDKLIATNANLLSINPDIKATLHPEGYDIEKPPHLSGYIFLCVDNIDLRRKITEQCKPNAAIKAMFDFRMRLLEAQHYAADWTDAKQKEAFLDSMQFTHAEATAENPINACGSSLSIVPTVRMIVSAGVSNMINFTREGKIKKLILIDAFNFTIDAF